jgi:hypothetical protein
MNRVIITSILILSGNGLIASPCVKYDIELGTKATHGELTLTWFINTRQNSCGFPKDEVFKHQFVVTIMNLFDDVLLTDTVDRNYFRFNTSLVDNQVLLFSYQEFGSSTHEHTIPIRKRNCQR